MGNIISKKIISVKEFSLSLLKNKTIAVDTSSLIYKYIYAFSKQPLSADGKLTSHLYGITKLLLNFKKNGLRPIMCFDLEAPKIKKTTSEKRHKIKKNFIQWYEETEKNRNMSSTEKKRYELSKINILKCNETIVELMKIISIPYALKTGVEAEKLCANLKKSGIVDFIYSPDKDVCLYGEDTVINIDFNKKIFNITALDESLYKWGISKEEFFICAVASGTDYSKGLFGIGPTSAINYCKRYGAKYLNDKLEKNIVDFKTIVDYISKPIEDNYLVLNKKNSLEEVVTYFKKLNFNDKLITEISAEYILKDSLFEVKVNKSPF